MAAPNESKKLKKNLTLFDVYAMLPFGGSFRQPERFVWCVDFALALAAGYALSTFLAFPHPVAGGVLDLGLALGFVAPALFWLLVRELRPAEGLRWGFLASLVAHSLVLHWIYVVTVSYGHAPVVVGLVAPVGLAAYIALFGAGVGATSAWLASRGAARSRARFEIERIPQTIRSQ